MQFTKNTVNSKTFLNAGRPLIQDLTATLTLHANHANHLNGLMLELMQTQVSSKLGSIRRKINRGSKRDGVRR